jgi:hypothetical protein
MMDYEYQPLNVFRARRRKPRVQAVLRLQDQGFTVRAVNGEYHYRINGVLDYYPTRNLYHDLKKNVRGEIRDMTATQFIVDFFKKEKDSGN